MFAKKDLLKKSALSYLFVWFNLTLFCCCLPLIDYPRLGTSDTYETKVKLKCGEVFNLSLCLTLLSMRRS